MIELTDQEYAELSEFVKVNYGINLSDSKTFVQLRLSRLMAQTSHSSFADYFAAVCQDITGEAISDFISSLTINHTLFNREPGHFAFFQETVMPYLVKRESHSRDLRIWSAGCATGEEPYTLAMVISDFLGTQKALWDSTILATDISTFALKKAVAGIYPIESIEALRPAWQRNYFEHCPDDPAHVAVVPSLRKEVLFRRHNLVGGPFHFKEKFHCIFCRNVMIYFDLETQQKLIQRFYDCLGPGGYLFIGTTESIDKASSPFEYVQPSVYRKK